MASGGDKEVKQNQALIEKLDELIRYTRGNNGNTYEIRQSISEISDSLYNHERKASVGETVQQLHVLQNEVERFHETLREIKELIKELESERQEEEERKARDIEWEYFTMDVDYTDNSIGKLDKELDGMGRQGYELVSVEPYFSHKKDYGQHKRLVFKRKKIE